MSSLPRRMKRKRDRIAGTHKGKETPFVTLPDGGYLALSATKGWKRFSAARLRAQAKLAALRDEIDRRMGRSV